VLPPLPPPLRSDIRSNPTQPLFWLPLDALPVSLVVEVLHIVIPHASRHIHVFSRTCYPSPLGDHSNVLSPFLSLVRYSTGHQTLLSSYHSNTNMFLPLLRFLSSPDSRSPPKLPQFCLSELILKKTEWPQFPFTPLRDHNFSFSKFATSFIYPFTP